MAIVGMDIEQVRSRLVPQMNEKAGQIEEIWAQLNAILQDTEWRGPDRERFVGEWNGQHRTQMFAVAEAVRAAAQQANDNATQQEQASG